MVFEMPIFGPSQFEKLTEKATNESNVSEDWQSILECCDYLSAQQSRPLDCLRSIMKRMSHPHPNVSIQAIILLDACVSNCGKKFHLEVASREFLGEARKLLEKGHPKVVERFKLMIKKWSENEFKSDPELSMIPSFYTQLKKEGYDFTDPSKPNLPKDPNVVISDQEEEDIIKALELSMKDVKGSSSNSNTRSTNSGPTTTTSSIYPDINTSVISDISSRNSSQPADTMRNPNKKEPFKVRALYDFEAAEDNELTFKASEVILVTDDRDENWWTGSNHRGEGLFPANFVTKDLDAPIDDSTNIGMTVQFDDQVRVKFLEEEVTEVDENKIDRLLHLIHEADPTGVTPDSDELIMLEDQCGRMGKLIDRELERLDRIQVALNMANRQLTEAMDRILATSGHHQRDALIALPECNRLKMFDRMNKFSLKRCLFDSVTSSVAKKRIKKSDPPTDAELLFLNSMLEDPPTTLICDIYFAKKLEKVLQNAKLLGLCILITFVITSTARVQAIESNGNKQASQQQQLFGNEDFTFARNGSLLQIDAGREWPFNSKREISFKFKTKSPHGLLIYQTFDHNKLQREEDQENLELVPQPVVEPGQETSGKSPIDLSISQSIVKTATGQRINSNPLRAMSRRDSTRLIKRQAVRSHLSTSITTTATISSGEQQLNVRHLSRIDSDKVRDSDPRESLSHLGSSTVAATASEKLVNSLFSSSHISAISGNSPSRGTTSQALPRDKAVLATVKSPGRDFTVRDSMSSARNRLLNSIVSTIDLEEPGGRLNYGIRPKVESNDGSPVLSSSAINSLSASLYELYIKLENGRLKIVYEFGSRLNQTYCGKSLNDDRWHRVDLKVDPEINQMVLTLDQIINVEIVLSQAQQEEENIRRNELVFTNSVLYLGGLNNNASIVKNVRQRLYLAQFIGCIGQIMLKTDQSTESTLQPAPIDRMALVKRGCVNLCESDNYCLHKSACLNYYTHTKCDCFGTHYEDTYCWQSKLTTLSMLGYSTLVYRIYDWRDRHHSNSNRFSMQFRTLARDSILFFAYGDLSTQQAMRNPMNYSQTSASSLMNLGFPMAQVNISSLPTTIHRPQGHQVSNNNNYLAISLSNGTIVVEMSFGDQPILLSNLLYDKITNQTVSQQRKENSTAPIMLPTLSDGQWHNISIVHHGKQLTLYMDNQSVSHTILSKNNHLYFDPSIYVGGVPNFLLNETRALLRPINLRHKFVGCMKSVYFNQHNILLDLKQGSQMVEYRDILGKPLLDTCEAADPNSLPITLRSGKSYLTFQLSSSLQSSTIYSARLESSVKSNNLEKTTKSQSQETLGMSMVKKLTWIEFEYRTSLQKHFLAGGHLRDLSYHDLGGFWTLQAREECQLYFTISSGLTFDPEQVLVLDSKEKACTPGQWYKVSISIMSGDKELNITRTLVDTNELQNYVSDHGSFILSSSVELLHQVQLGGDLAKFGESSSIPFSGCIRRININGHCFDSRDFVTTLTSVPSGVMTNINQQNLTLSQQAQVTQYDVISSRMAQGYVTIDSCRLVNPCSTLNPCKNGGICKINELGEPDCDCSKTGYTGRKCHFSIYKRSCQDLFLSGQRKSSFYLIDLDRNGPLKPIRVRCNMDAGVDHIETSLSHNLPAEYLIRRSSTADLFLDITYLAFHHMYTHDGFYVHDDTDESAQQQQDLMLRTLIGQSTFCKQHFRYECRSAPLNLGNQTWMEVPYPKRHRLMSLDGLNLGKCACASTEKRCLNPKMNCNCDSGESIWSDDSYDLINHEQVGLTRIILLRQTEKESDSTSKQNTLGAVESQSRVSLSDLKCYGTKEYGNQHEITFKTSDAYIEVPGWRRGDISFNFRTASNPPAIILYQLATSRNHGYFRLTLITDTRLLFEFIVNRRPRRLFLTASHRLNNGEWQQVFIEYDAANLRLTVNDDSVLVDLDPNDHLGTFEGPMFIGGAPSKYLVGELSRRNGFTGCFKGLNINGRSIDLNDYLSSSMPTVTSGCRPSCTKNLCQNGGRCIEYWGSYDCECSNPIAHSGSNCEINLNTNSITFVTQESHYVEQTGDSLVYPPYLVKSILLNIRTYQETALVLYALDQYNNFIQLHKNGSSLVLTFNSNVTIITVRVPIDDETASNIEVPSSSTSPPPPVILNSPPSTFSVTQENSMPSALTKTPLQSSSISTTIGGGNSSLTTNSTALKLQPSMNSIITNHNSIELDKSSIRVSNTSGSGQPIQVKIERQRLRTTFYVNNNFVIIEKPLILLTNYTQFPWINPESELVRPLRTKSVGSKTFSKIFLANIDEHFTTRLPGFTGCIQGFSIDNQLFDFNRAHLTGELRGDYKIGCKMHCDSFPCKNQGTCVENWVEDKIQCKCDTTSYVGRLCDEDIAAIFNGFSSHFVYHLSRKLSMAVVTAADRVSNKVTIDQAKAIAPPSSLTIVNGTVIETNNDSSTTSPNEKVVAPSNSPAIAPSHAAVNFLEVNLAFSSEVNQSRVEQRPTVQVLLWISMANSSRYFFLGLTSDGGLLVQEDYGNSMSLSRLIKKPERPFNDGYRHMVKYARYNQTIQIVVDHQAYLPTMSVIASNRMNRYSKTSSIFVGTSDYNQGTSKLSEREAQQVNDEFINYSGCMSNLIIKLDSLIIEPLSEAFGQNLETINVNSTKPSQSGSSESLSISLNKVNNLDGAKRDSDSSTSSAAIKFSENPDDYKAINVATRDDESFTRTRLLNMVNKESGQDVMENMETIVARNVEQGKCASFKRIENSNEKRSVNEPKITQLLDPRPAYMDPPRIKLYERHDKLKNEISSKPKAGKLFYCSLTFLIVVISSTAIYAYILQVRYKSEKFRCETPFFHNKRDEMTNAAARTPTPPNDE